MKSWSSFEFLTSFFALAIGLVAAIFLGLLNLTGSHVFSADPIGTIVYKLRVAESKHTGQNLWETLPQNSVVYEADTIRTAEQSEAEVTLNKQSKISLGPNTMIQLNTKRNFLLLTKGTVRVKSEGRLALKSAHGTYALNKGEAIIRSDEKQTTAVVLAGILKVNGRDEVQAGNSVSFGSAGTAKDIPLTPLEPSSGSILYTDKPEESVEVRWSAPKDWKGQLLVSEDPAMKAHVVKRDISGGTQKISLKPGVWWWSVGDAAGATEPQSFQLKKLTSPEILRSAGVTSITSDGAHSVDVRWTPVPSASQYRLEISETPDFSKLETQMLVDSSFLSVPLPKAGTHFIRVAAVFSALNQESFSAVSKVVIGEKNSQEPLQWTDNAGSAIQLSAAIPGGNLRMLRWSNDSEPCKVRVAEDAAMTNVIVDETITSGVFKLGEDLKPGKYFVEIERPATESAPASKIQRTVSIQTPVPPAAVSPVGGKLAVLTNDRTVEVSVHDPNDSSRLQIEVSENDSFNPVTLTTFAEKGIATLPLKPKNKIATWFWRARVLSVSGESLAVSPTESFQTPAFLEAPVITSPEQGSKIDLFKNRSVKLFWAPIDGANRYQVILNKIIMGKLFRTKVWETNRAEYEWNDFKNLSVGSYSFEIVALNVDKKTKSIVAQSSPSKSSLILELSEKLKSTSIKIQPGFEVD